MLRHGRDGADRKICLPGYPPARGFVIRDNRMERLFLAFPKYVMGEVPVFIQ